MKSKNFKRTACLCCAALLTTAFVGCGGDPSGSLNNSTDVGSSSSGTPVSSGGVGEYNKITFYDKLFGNERKYSESEFFDPAVEYRLLPVLNEDASKPKGASIANLEKLKKYGYGGVVTNVGWTDDYLFNDTAWELLEEAVAYAVEDLGLRVWLYDEYAYPSGGARNLVLKDNPEWQAQGVAQKSFVVPAGVTQKVTCPEEHTLLAAYAYPGGALASVSVSSALACRREADGTAIFVNDTGKECVMICLYKKNWYEGTHPQWNIMESRRYIDVMNPAPVGKFIDVTYEAYKKHLGKYFNNGIESFFYDEPALPGIYKSRCSVLNVLDEPNENLEILDTYNYSPVISEYFLERWGYDMTPYLPYLYKSGSEVNESAEAMRFRLHYNTCVSELFAENYFGQIADWCGANNINASGHLLGEESPMLCTVYSGNIMRDYAQVQIPGVDFLYGDPEAGASNANVLKTCSSSAQFYGKSRVFCEVSDWGVPNEDWDARICTVALQYACGVNTFVSYYEPFNYDEETNRKFADTTARIGYMLGGGIGEKDVAVYYPSEGFFAAAAIDTTGFWANSMADVIASNYTSLAYSLLKNQIDYENLDAEMIRECKIENGKLVTPAGETFSALVVPKTYAMYSDVLDKILLAAENGVKIYLQDGEGWLCEDKDKQTAFDSAFGALKENGNTTVQASVSKLVSDIEGYAFLSADSEDIVACKQKNADNSVYLFCNTAAETRNVTLKLSDEKAEFRLWHPSDGAVEEIEPVSSSDGWSTFRLSLSKYECVLITAE